MDLVTMNNLNLWDQRAIEKLIDWFNPILKIGVISDLHAGSKYGEFPSQFVDITGNIRVGKGTNVEIYKAIQQMGTIFGYYDIEMLIGLGDLIGYLTYPNPTSYVFFDIDNCKKLAVQVWKELTRDVPNVKGHIISGSKFHDSRDTLTHLDVANLVGAKFHPIGYIFLRIKKADELGIMFAHQTLTKAMYKEGIMFREDVFNAGIQKSGEMPDFDITIGGHYHVFKEVPFYNQTHILIGGWEYFHPIKGSIALTAIKMWDIGGSVLLVGENKRFLHIPYKFKIKQIQETTI